ncbi:MAG TPA: HAD family hydrolase [Mycobacteriales bacterium]|jgi:phosphoglycolate phosphatase-like HAD superfamily hydrolase|nr:HAD family hydrolase [Mycobacteriales bacterium]
MTDSPAAVLFDVDGTLLDTNYLHAIAWWESFLAAGEEVSCFDIHRNIGRGSPDLVQTLLGREDDAIVAGHSERWAPLRERMIPFHRAAELLRECDRRGLRVVLATSGSPEDVEDFRAKLDCDDAVYAVVNSGDVEQSKPDPAIVHAALEAAGVGADRAVMVGDTVYDIRAARAAGVAVIGLLGGGIGEQELRQDEPTAIFGNCSELLDGLDDSPIGALLR